jgi:hypothetical protein
MNKENIWVEEAKEFDKTTFSNDVKSFFFCLDFIF